MNPLFHSARLRPHLTRLALAFSVLAIAFGSACGDGVTPELRALRFLGQAPDSTAVLLFELDFFDGDGDLGDGLLETFIGQRTSELGALDLTSIFARSDLDVTATEGTLDVVVELAFPRDEPLPADGSTFDLGFRAIDAAQRTSELVQVGLTLNSN